MIPPVDAAPLRVLIVEDEPPARRRLRSLLQRHSDVIVTGEATHGGEAVALIEGTRPDVELLDVELPVASGFEVIEAVGADRMPNVIFVTAYDHYAIRAFEVHALDYLLKPVEPERLATALAHARRHEARTAELTRVVADVRPLAMIRRIPVRLGPRILFVDIPDIDYVQADGNYVRLHTRSKSYLVRETLNAFEERLRPYGFLRIHRSTIVHGERIAEVEPLFHGEYAVKLKDGTKLRSGRSYRDQLRVALHLEHQD